VATEYGGAYGDKPWRHAAPSYGGQPPYRARRSRRRRLAALTALVLGALGLALSLTGVAFQLLPRQFTQQQQRQIKDWEIGKRWQTLTAGDIFPASLTYAPPTSLTDGANLRLTASRIGIARQASCTAATDKTVGPVLARYGCQAMLRATYVDGTDSYVITVGVAAMPGSARAKAAQQELAGVVGTNGAGVRTVPVAGSLAAAFTDGRRQLAASSAHGPYLVFYTIGYTDDRPPVPVSADNYADSEMTAAEAGVVSAVVAEVDAPVPAPGCPGTPGC